MRIIILPTINGRLLTRLHFLQNCLVSLKDLVRFLLLKANILRLYENIYI